MQVYANAFEVQGEGANDVCFRAVHGWLSQQIDGDLTLSDLKSPNSWQGQRNGKSVWLRAYICEDEGRSLYAWRLKHGDDSVPGRQWTVEIGLACSSGLVQFSCSIQTDEQSTEVTKPVTPSQPRLIGYLLTNINDAPNAYVNPSTPGRHIKHIGQSSDDYRAFLTEIQNPQRGFPLVMVSPDKAGSYLIDREHLRDQLFGLAQVVEVAEDFNSFEMEAVLGRYWSAWDGAVNVIRTPHPSGKIIGTPILSDQILAQGQTQRERISHILGKVTHNTNIPRLREQISPNFVLHQVNRKNFEKRLASLRERFSKEGVEQVEQLLEDLVEIDERQRALSDENQQLELSLLQAKEENQGLEDEIRRLKYLVRYSSNPAMGSSGPENDDGLALNELALSLIAEGAEPSPAEALQLIGSAYPNCVVVLPNALDTAQEVCDFQQGRRLFHMLRRLVTDYREKIRDAGDAGARSVFTPREYAAGESETVNNSPAYLAYRQFEYDGEPITMRRHLKVGVADDTRKTIRVYFEWDARSERIIIGHCGKHLPVPSH